MKASREHRVPVSESALDVLGEAAELADGGSAARWSKYLVLQQL